jgi:hypothetical protein
MLFLPLPQAASKKVDGVSLSTKKGRAKSVLVYNGPDLSLLGSEANRPFCLRGTASFSAIIHRSSCVLIVGIACKHSRMEIGLHKIHKHRFEKASRESSHPSLSIQVHRVNADE